MKTSQSENKNESNSLWVHRGALLCFGAFVLALVHSAFGKPISILHLTLNFCWRNMAHSGFSLCLRSTSAFPLLLYPLRSSCSRSLVDTLEAIPGEVSVFISDMSGFTKTTRKHGIIHFASLILKMRHLLIPVLKKHDAIVIFPGTALRDACAGFIACLHVASSLWVKTDQLVAEADNLWCVFPSSLKCVQAAIEATNLIKRMSACDVSLCVCDTVQAYSSRRLQFFSR